MRIFLVSNLYPSRRFPNFGTFVAGFAHAMEKQGAEIAYKSVIDKVYKSKVMHAFVYIVFCVKTILIGLFGKYDIVYVHYIAHTSVPVLFFSLIRKKKIVLNPHGDDILPRTYLVKLLQYVIRVLLKKVDLVVVPSQYFEGKFLERFCFSSDKIYVYPSGGINHMTFQHIDVQRSELGINDDDIVLGFVSRIVYGKGWDLFIQVLNKLLKQNSHIRGIIIGDGDEVTNLKSLLSSLNMKDKILYIEGVKHSELKRYYSAMDLFIFPSFLLESLGLVGLEAMACGTPVVASEIGGIKDFVIDEFNGFMFKPKDISDLEYKILLWLELPKDKKEKMRLNALKTASDFDSNTVSVALYNKLTELC
ncbi:glycosyltransferase family 4 protein [uncultured Bacteroides sp.]|uniref:glycosyltransferase family 4 protein n=1 Tax=uncultured Bacteroides sp. TaxID=162156 RepID=UPI00259A4A7A|nr:glycosyltransferase family 4 protein [uncultured Bacteroides sp.]